MRGRTGRRVTSIVVTGGLVVAALVAAANAESSLQVALHRKHDMQDRIEEIQETRRLRRIVLHQRIRFARHGSVTLPGCRRSATEAAPGSIANVSWRP